MPMRSVHCVLIVSALLTGLLAAPASAAPATNYVALGDSFSSGNGAGAYSGGDCHRSANAYPVLHAAQAGATSFTHAACSGAVTEDVLADQVTELSPGTTLVTLTIGGNDVGFSKAMTICSIPVKRVLCKQAVADGLAELPALSGKLDDAYAAIRQAAPAARLVVLGYPHLFELGTCLHKLTEVLVEDRKVINDATDQLDRLIADRAQAAGARFVDVRDTFAGHGACGDSPWINEVNLAAVFESYHPNAAGHRGGYLAALTAAIG
ncbi:SGNH/GDSL hydrolase family protein [Pseudonocardiaceae bacterium YIM PH 21723]|nr:SGNH/GDSL hydrolase family protein [Pseudonocardiaceae bacterium YIM PH 21723]